jgi:hypothetical protein
MNLLILRCFAASRISSRGSPGSSPELFGLFLLVTTKQSHVWRLGFQSWKIGIVSENSIGEKTKTVICSPISVGPKLKLKTPYSPPLRKFTNILHSANTWIILGV